MRSMQHEIACNNLLPFKHVNEGFQPKCRGEKRVRLFWGLICILKRKIKPALLMMSGN